MKRLTKPAPQAPAQRGVTLIESVTTLATTAVVLSVGVPGYQHVAANQLITGEINQMVAHLHLARSEAVTLRSRVLLCPSADGASCANEPHWEIGYILFADTNRNRERDDGEPILRQHQPHSKQLSIRSSQYRKRLVFQDDGTTPGSNPTLVFCDTAQAGTPRALIVSNTGRPRVSDTSPDGSKLDCG